MRRLRDAPGGRPRAGTRLRERECYILRVVRAAAAALVALATLRLFLLTRHYGLLGWDSYPLIRDSRAFLGAGGFQRPLLGLSLAIDRALWGLEPAGYQLTSALLFAACGGALFALARSLAGPAAAVGPLAALAAFLVFPAHFEILPSPARRPDLLCILFLALAVRAGAAAARSGARGAAVASAAFVALAIASKETGYAAGPLLAGVAWACAPGAGRARLRHAFASWLPVVAAIAALLGLRLAVLGGIGTGRPVDPLAGLARVPGFALELAGRLMAPQTADAPLALPFAGLLLAAAVLAAAWEPARRSPGERPLRAWIAVAGLWIAACAAIYALGGIWQPWYLSVPGAGLALLTGALAEAAWRAARRPGGSRLAASALGLLLALLVGRHAAESALFRRYDEWERAAEIQNRFLRELAARLESAADGARIELARPTPWVRTPGKGPKLSGAAVMRADGIQAWAELAHPERRVRVVLAPAASGAPDGVTVVLTTPGRTPRTRDDR